MRAATAVVVLLLLSSCSGTDSREHAELVAPGLRLTQPRAVHRATLLQDGRVLVTGGCTESGCGGFDAGRRAEVYDGARGLVPDAEMGVPRASGSATLLADGRVLLVGGYPGEGEAPTSSAEVYDPVADTFTRVGELSAGRADQSATLLPDGRVLVAGGFDGDGHALDSTEYFDPSTGTFAPGPRLLEARAAHVGVLAGSEVVLVGGTRNSHAIAATEVLDPRIGTWAPGPDLITARVKLGAVAVGAGRVFVVGGATDTEGRAKLRSTEVLDVVRGSSLPGPELSQGEYKLDGAVVGLADGRIVVGGGDALEVYDAALDDVQRVEVPSYDSRSFRTVTAVGPDTVLVLGGYDADIVPTDAAYLVRIPG